jgi:hypothetical protein
MNFIYVVMNGDYPILVAHTQSDIEQMLDDYNGTHLGDETRVRYEPYNSKYPSINDLEGTYYYRNTKTHEETAYKVYGTEYKREIK